jgi:hypothetical protein
MIKLVLPLALLALATLYKIYKDYEGDRKKALLDIVLLLFLLGATLFSKYLRVYMPLLVAHVVLLLLAWGSYYLYLFGRKKLHWLIFAPLLSIALFFLLGFLERAA